MTRNSKNPPSYQGAHNLRKFSKSQSLGLNQLCKNSKSTMFVLMLSMFKALLYRYTRESDLLVATPVSNRNQLNLEKLIGFFNETLVIRDTLDGDTIFSDLLKNVQSTVWEGFAHQAIPFELIVKELKPERLISGNPLFQVMFLYHQVPKEPMINNNLQWTVKPLDTGVAKFDLTLYISEENEQLTSIFEYATDVFEEATIEMMQGHLSCLVDGILKNPEARLDELPLLTQNERELILNQWNKAGKPSKDSETITQIIEDNIQKFPNRTAVAFHGESITYEELGNRAAGVANRIQSITNQSSSPLGIFAERSIDMIIGILAALKLGRTYVPLDPKYPWSRIEMIINDSLLTEVVVQDHLEHKFADHNISTISCSNQTTDCKSVLSQSSGKKVSSMVYTIYTSGSTGKPKGVPVSHNNLLHSTLARRSFYREQPGTFLLLSSFSFDSSVAGIFWTLCSGGTLVLPKEKLEQDVEALSSLIEKQKVTHTLLLPSLYQLLLRHAEPEKLQSLRTVIVAGESCHPEVVKLHFEALPETKLFNEYGPTEATVWSTVHQVQPTDSTGTIPIGKPIAGTQILILDENKSLVPAGVTGEIYIGGPGVVSGYLNQPDADRKLFIINPIDKQSTDKIYRTGDLGRYRNDGSIEFLGRADQQIKLRGYRVEPGEIVRSINQYPGITGCEIQINPHVASKDDSRLIEDDTQEIAVKLQSIDPEMAENLLRSIENLEHFNFQATHD